MADEPATTTLSPAAVPPHRWAVPATAAALLGMLSLAIPASQRLLLTAGAAVLFIASAATTRSWWTPKIRAAGDARSGWLLVSLAAAVSSWAATASLSGVGRGEELAIAVVSGAASSALMIAGTLTLIGGRVRGRGIDSALEALLVAVPATFLALAVLIDHRPDSVRWAHGVAAIVAVAIDTVLLLVGTDLIRVQPQRLSVPAMLVVAGACSLLGMHAAIAHQLLVGSANLPSSGLLIMALHAVPAALWLTAALHPDARDHLDPAEVLPTALTPVRVLIVLVAVALGPMTLALRVRADGGRGVIGLGVGAVVVAGVAVAYLVRLVEQRAHIEYLALHDDLCRIPNRVLLRDRIGSALAQAPRHERRVALLFLDLDRFKNINDSLGHDAGNELLKAASDRVCATVRGGDTVARLSGDEFAVLLPDVIDALAPANVAEKLLAAFDRPFEIEGRQLFVSASIGISLFPDDAADADELLRNADVAMYRAKENGRDRFELYTTEMNARAHQRLSLESSLHLAIDRGELVMYYQPKVELRTGTIVGMEALMRWEHPDLGLVGPGEFIPLAEETGLIVPLGEWALEQAAAQTKSWVDAGFGQLTVAVNVSARQFQHDQVGDVVARVLRATRLDPRALELELTESLALQDPEAISLVLRDLKDMGVQCSIDDFGTGYSGLGYLTRFPIDKLKIDRFFIREISHGEDHARIVSAVIALAHSLHLEVIAEGVENHEQRAFLDQQGCDVMQGFLFSRAIPADEFEALLHRERDGSALGLGWDPVSLGGVPVGASLPDPAVAVRVRPDAEPRRRRVEPALSADA